MLKPCIQCGNEFDDGGNGRYKVCGKRCRLDRYNEYQAGRRQGVTPSGMYPPKRAGLSLHQMLDKLDAWAERNWA